ncbi:hypothetical protein [Paracidovorax citrulli]
MTIDASAASASPAAAGAMPAASAAESGETGGVGGLLEQLRARGGSLRLLLGIDGVRLEVLYSYGCRLFREHKHEEARQVFFALAAIDPLSFDYALSLGICLQKLHRHDEAIFCLSKAVASRLTDPRPWYLLGVSFQIEGDVGRARESYRAAVKVGGSQGEFGELRTLAMQSLAALEEGERE